MPFNPLYVRSFDKPLISPQEVEGVNQKNALGRIDLQNEQLKQQVLSNPDYGMAAQAQASMGQHKMEAAQNAGKLIGEAAMAVANSQDPVNAAHSILGHPLFAQAWQAVGGDPNQIEQMRSYVSDPQTTRQHAIDLARQFGVNPNAGQTTIPQGAVVRDANGKQVFSNENPGAVDWVRSGDKLVPKYHNTGQAPPGLQPMAGPPSQFAGGEATPDVINGYRDQILAGNGTLQNVPLNVRNQVTVALNSTGKEQYSPMAASRMTLAASRITQQFTNMSAYKLTADGKPYLERIDAAMKNPGSVSDNDLLDSLVKLNTGGNAVTDAQVRLITDGKSFADLASTAANKFKNGGVLSQNQRQQIHDIAYQIYENYQKGYQPIYDRAARQLTEAGIPKQFWTIPDLNNLSGDFAGGSGGTPKRVKVDANGDVIQ